MAHLPAYDDSESDGENLSDFEEADNLALLLEDQEEADESDMDFVAGSDEESEDEAMEADNDGDQADQVGHQGDQVVPHQAGVAVVDMELEDEEMDDEESDEESEEESEEDSEEESGISDSYVSSSSDM